MLAPPPSPHLTSDLAVGYLIAAGGNSKLAALNASRELAPLTVTEASLLATITNDPRSLDPLSNQLRLLIILNAIEAFRLTHIAYLQALPSLTPRDTANTYTKILDLLTRLTPSPPAQLPPLPPELPPPTDIDMDSLIEALPAEVQESVRYFVDNPP